jgi:proteic killer suppression protein
MEVQFGDDLYDRLEIDARFFGGFPYPVVTAYRKRLQQIRSAVDERDFYALKSLRFEKLKGSRDHQYSMRLNDQWRLVIEIHGKGSDKVIIIIGIEDYH